MSDKKEEKNVIATTRQFERIKIIHEHIKNMEYPNVPRLVEIINARANTKEEETSIPTINRDIGLMKEQYKAPIKYDSFIIIRFPDDTAERILILCNVHIPSRCASARRTISYRR